MNGNPQKRRNHGEWSTSITDGNRSKRRQHGGDLPSALDDHSTFQRGYNEYTVAVVCALGFEMSAVRYMLDQEHPTLPAKKGDQNIYVLGELSGHNIVIACLPGNQGKSAAAIVATHLQRTFPSIQYRLLVGIGGGAPSCDHDIRLGDVVVSMPDGQSGGVIQYDLGKDTEDEFTLKGFLCSPPPVLRGAVIRMQSDHLGTQSKINDFMSTLVEKGKHFASYQRPPANSDLIFEPDYPHEAGQVTCARCDKSRLENRPPRISEAPVIHYGLIASGDRVMRSAPKRNRTGQNVGDVLCFEMEVAGIATEFPCIAVRGISDYADSHKNDAWQHYAAAAAAGCAKEILSYVAPEHTQAISQKPLQHRFSNDSHGSLELYRNERISVSQGGSSSEMKISKISEQRERREYLTFDDDQWQTLLDSLRFDQIDARHNTIKKEHEKTCRWLLKNSKYLEWLDDTKLVEHHGFLWIKGKPGAGKSTLMKFAFTNARRTLKDSIIISFFFNARGEELEKSTVGLYRSLVLQLLERLPALRIAFDPADFSVGARSTDIQWNVELLEELLERAVQKLGQTSIICFIDALDECEEQQIRNMISFFERVGN